MSLQFLFFRNECQEDFRIIEIARLSVLQKDGDVNVKMIEIGLKKPGKLKSGLAEALGIPNSAVTELLAGRRLIKADEIPKIVQYLELDQVPIMGRVGAGATIEPDYEQVPHDGLGMVQLPFGLPDEMIAFEVKGDSMLPRYDDGDIIVVWRYQRRALASFYGEEAVVRTAEGHRYLKRIEPRRGGKTVTLTSFNAKPIEGARLEWIGEIFLTFRAGQLRRLESRTR